jgi:hypothetical protein
MISGPLCQRLCHLAVRQSSLYYHSRTCSRKVAAACSCRQRPDTPFPIGSLTIRDSLDATAFRIGALDIGFRFSYLLTWSKVRYARRIIVSLTPRISCRLSLKVQLLSLLPCSFLVNTTSAEAPYPSSHSQP